MSICSRTRAATARSRPRSRARLAVCTPCAGMPSARARCGRRSKELYEELGLQHRRAARSLIGANIELLAGDAAAAERELRLGYDTLAAMGETYVRATLAAYLAAVLAELGRDDEALTLTRESEMTQAQTTSSRRSSGRGARARALGSGGDRTEAATLAREAVRRAAETDFVDLRAGGAPSRSRSRLNRPRRGGRGGRTGCRGVRAQRKRHRRAACAVARDRLGLTFPAQETAMTDKGRPAEVRRDHVPWTLVRREGHPGSRDRGRMGQGEEGRRAEGPSRRRHLHRRQQPDQRVQRHPRATSRRRARERNPAHRKAVGRRAARRRRRA